MTIETEDVARRLRRESQRLFPDNQRDGHAYHSTADALDKAADTIERLREENARRGEALERIAADRFDIKFENHRSISLERRDIARAALNQQ